MAAATMRWRRGSIGTLVEDAVRVEALLEHAATGRQRREGRQQPQEELPMTRRSKIWLVVALLFMALNLLAAGFALAGWELHHAGIHVALVLPAAFLAWRLAPKRVASY